MLPLAEVQRRLSRAVVTGDVDEVAPLVTGGRDVRARVAIHHRHYETSLVTALLGKFPATAWLVGTPFLEERAERFVREHPPRELCIAEFGEEFPRYLAHSLDASRVPYVLPFAELEWQIGLVALAVDHPGMGMEALASVGAELLTASVLTLQPGVRYIAAPWPVDELMRLFLTEQAPDRLTLAPENIWLELRGVRGAFSMKRLDVADFIFRRAIRQRLSLGEAAGLALDSQSAFEPGTALAAIVAEGLMTTITPAGDGTTASQPWPKELDQT